jgi:hypothetical protein
MRLLTSDNLTLVVGDVHVGPNQDLRRADLLGKAIADLEPNRVVFIGDFLNFDSLSDWDKDKRKTMEGRRYARDIDSGREFLSMCYNHIPDVTKMDWHLCEGNHERRLHRYIESDPLFDGAVDYIRDLGIDKWTITPFKSYVNIAGIDFTHVPINEAGKPIGGKYVCSKALDINHNSVVFGHTHKLDTASVHRHGAPHLQIALNVGCYFEHIEDYAKGSITSYWRGIVLVDHYKHGRFSWMPIPLGKMRKTYGVTKRRST